IQRVAEAEVAVSGETVGRIGTGLLVFLGVAESDEAADLDYLARKVPALRIFPDEAGQLNLSVAEAGGSLLVASQFTLIAGAAKGNRPSFLRAARREQAAPACEAFVARLRAAGLNVATGVFGADMKVRLLNDGPVTILLDSREEA